MGEVADAYAGVRSRVRSLVVDADASAPVPACPQWTVKDVVSHLAGVVDDALAGRLDGVATDPWTDAQVQARRSMSIGEVLNEWDEKAPGFEGLLDSIGPGGRQAVFDAVTHEHDLRGALDAPGARDSDAVRVGFGFSVQGLLASCPGLRLVATDTGDVWGDGDVEVSGPIFELFRAGSGRRSAAQIRERLTWSADPGPYLDKFTWGPFKVPEDDVPE